MNTPDLKPEKKHRLNPKLLPVAGVLLILLALLFMATPLLRASRGAQSGGSFVFQGNGQFNPQNGTQGQDGVVQGQAFPGQGSRQQQSQGNRLPQGQGVTGQGNSNFLNRRVIMGIGFLGGRTGTIVYFLALLVSLAAFVGMLLVKRWGQILGILMAILYFLAGLVSLLPILLFISMASRNLLSLILGIVHVVLSLAVIVLSLIPARKIAIPVMADLPPAASA